MPFSVHHNVDHPVSLYAATKKANELMAHAYASLYEIPCTGLLYTAHGEGLILPCFYLRRPSWKEGQ
jgi:UDP-glucuronate 4-epimerase